ncbi:MAG: cyclic nucleotide-binding domain-containing protein [Chloroflexi bacterium]|nr:cyclic nucleotide-binding domain-containing protein [Chloroflexota bacterium]
MADQQIDFSHILQRFPIFQGLDDNALRSIYVDQQLTFRPGEELFHQSDPIQFVYLILSGSVRLEHRGGLDGLRLVHYLGPNEAIGRLELDTLEGQLGTATARSLTRVLAIDKRVLAQLRNTHPHLANQFDRSEVIGHLRASPYLSHLSDIEVKWLSDIVAIRTGGPDDVLFRQGQPGQSILLIRQGRVRIKHPHQPEQWASAGAVLGQRSAITGRRHLTTTTCDSICHYYDIPAEPLRNIARQHHQNLEEFLRSPIDVPAILAKEPLFQHLQPVERAHLAGYTMQLHYNQPHRTVARQNKNDSYYYVLVRGDAVATRVDPETGQSLPRALTPGTAFGEASLLLGDPAPETVETTSPTDWIRIHRQDFALFLAAHPHIHDRLTISYDVQKRLQNSERVFDWQEDGEVILCKKRRHWIVLLRNTAAFSALFMLLVGLDLLIDTVAPSPPPWWVQVLFVAFIPIPALVWLILDYSNDFHIVTSRRVAHQEKVIFFSEKRLSAPLDKIQDLQIKRSIWARTLGYGHLTIATAADAGHILFDYLPGASNIYELISDEMQRAKVGAIADNEETIRRQLQDRLHLGLEERLDSRALLENVAHKESKRSLTSRLPFNRLMGLQKQEGNTLVWRKHWWGLSGAVMMPSLTTTAIAIVMVLLALRVFSDFLSPGWSIVLGVLLFIGELVAAFWWWWSWTDWRNDLYIITDQRIEHIEQKPLFFDEERMVLSLERVQNVEFHKPSPLANLLDYGNVVIQTAAAEGRVVFSFVPEPDQVQADIFHRIENYREAQAALQQKQRKNDFADWLAAYHQIVQEERERESP